MPAEARMHLARRGDGPPLLLVHGIGHRWQAWEPVLDILAAAHDVIAVDLPGFGRSPLPDDGAPMDIPGLVSRLRALVDDLGLRHPHVAGNSLGGALALELAAAGAVASATAFSPAGFYTEAERRRAAAILTWLRLQSFLPQPVLRAALRQPAIRRSGFGTLVVHPERLDRDRILGDTLALRRGKAFRPVGRAMARYRFRPDGGGFGVLGDGVDGSGSDGGGLSGGGAAGPVAVTVAWGERDRILPPREAERARAALPWATHVTLPGCGHVPMSDDPDLVARTILGTTGGAPAEDPTAGATAG